jgi:CcmD family protein
VKYLFLAYGFAWGAVALYVAFLAARQGRLEKP